MVDYTKAIKRPFSDVKKLIIGGLLSMLPIVRWFSLGYAFKCGELTLKGKYKLAEWKNFIELFVKGFLLFLISFIYILPALLISLPFVIPTIKWFFLLFSSEPDPSMFLDILLKTWPFLLLSICLYILASYLIPFVHVNFIKHNQFKKAFALKEIFKNCFTKSYFLTWIVYVLIVIAISLGVSMVVMPLNLLNLIPFVVFIIIPIRMFIGGLMFFWVRVFYITVFSEYYLKKVRG